MKNGILKAFFWVTTLILLIQLSPINSWGAEKYPSRPIEFVHGFAPGGIADLTTRLFGKYLEKYLGGTVVVTSKTGGIGVVAATYVANSRPDGYTIGSFGDQLFTSILYKKATYSLEDIRVICLIYGQLTVVLCVPTDSPWKTFQDFIDHAKKNPGTTYGHSGPGASANLMTENLSKYANLKLAGVPFRGDSEVLVAVLGKHVPIGAFSCVTGKTQANAGKLRILFSFDPPADYGLDATIPDRLTVFGKNMPHFDIGIYTAAPRKIPDDVAEILEQATQKISRDPDYANEIKKFHMSAGHFVDGKTTMEEVIPQRMSRLKVVLQDLGLVK